MLYIADSCSKNAYIDFTCAIMHSRVCQERLREAARQQVRRLCQMKRKRSYLNPPAWLAEAYKTRDKTQMAQMLMDCNFNKDC